MKRWMLTFIGTVCLITIVLILLYIWNIKDDIYLDRHIRSQLPGEFISLKSGTICYQWHGKPENEIVILVHGFSIPKFVFTKNIDALVDAGFKVLLFDHFGRGYSDRPQVSYNTDFFDMEMIELFKALSIEKPVNVIGYSLGGGISTVFTACHSDYVKRLLLIAPVGYMDSNRGINRIMKIPLLGEWLFAVIGRHQMIKTFNKEYSDGIITKEMAILYEEQFSYRGYGEALLSTLRNYSWGELDSYYKKLAALNIPVKVIWGTSDETVPYDGSRGVKNAIPHCELITIKDGSHSLVYSQAERINSEIISFLK